VKRIIAAGVIAVFGFGGTGAAVAASPAKQIASLQKSVKALQKSVKALNTKVKNQQKTINALNGAFSTIDLCLIGATADALQSTWTAIDQVTATSTFGSQTTISDKGACDALNITRQGIRVPPTLSVFSALTSLFSGAKTVAFSESGLGR
jgi:uncharacterized protein YlxW (UPF0749 family)